MIYLLKSKGGHDPGESPSGGKGKEKDGAANSSSFRKVTRIRYFRGQSWASAQGKEKLAWGKGGE